MEAKTVWLTMLDDSAPVGKVTVDESGDAWVKINADFLAEQLGVEDIDGMALMRSSEFFNDPA